MSYASVHNGTFPLRHGVERQARHQGEGGGTAANTTHDWLLPKLEPERI
jgi:hypothetical protein